MLTIGIVNNMPPAAIHSTERQFRELLASAACDVPFEIRWFRLLPTRPSHYEPLSALWCSHLDGLIVTGAEPRASRLQDEVLWPALTSVVDWASKHTTSTIFSCLAAHAAVLYLDGIERCSSEKKIFGIFDSVKTSEHPLLAGTPDQWQVPHSRWNDLPEAALIACGYTVLARSRDAGVDLFTKQSSRSLLLFVQTHPEYSSNSLLREFLRDLTRFKNGQQTWCPAVPHDSFGEHQITSLEDLGHDAPGERQPRKDTLRQDSETPARWQPFAVQLYRNWLLHLLTQATHGMTAA